MVLVVLVVAFFLVVSVVALPLLLLLPRKPPPGPPKPPPGPPKTKQNKKQNKNQAKTLFTAIPGASEGVPGVDLDMPDSILTSLDLRNHQKHPKQRKNLSKNKIKKEKHVKSLF